MGTDVHSELLLLPFHDFSLCGIGVKLSIIVHSCPLKSFSTLTLQVCALCSFDIFYTAGCRLHQNEERGAKMTVLQPGSFLRTLVAKNASFSCFSPTFHENASEKTQHGQSNGQQWSAAQCKPLLAQFRPTSCCRKGGLAELVESWNLQLMPLDALTCTSNPAHSIASQPVQSLSTLGSDGIRVVRVCVFSLQVSVSGMLFQMVFGALLSLEKQTVISSKLLADAKPLQNSSV